MSGKHPQGVALVCTTSGDISELWVPSCRDTMRHPRHHLLLGIKTEERSKLQNRLSLESTDGLIDVYIGNAQFIDKDLIEDLVVVIHDKVALSANYDRIAVDIGVFEHHLHVAVGNGIDVYVVIADKGIGSIERYIAVDDVAYLPNVRNITLVGFKLPS